LRRRVRHGDHRLPHQPRIRPHRHRSADGPQGLSMMITALVLIPTVAGAVTFFLPPPRPPRAILALTPLAHAILTGATWAVEPSAAFGGWLGLDALGRIFLTITSLLFLAAALYAVGYLHREGHGERSDFAEGFLFDNAPEATFIACLLLFLAAMTLVAASQAFGLLWVPVEATTLASAPLIYFHRHHRSLEATWKYLLICSVGIALALLGNFFLAVAAADNSATSVRLVLPDLLARAGDLRV